MQIDRKEFLEEMILRENIRNIIKARKPIIKENALAAKLQPGAMALIQTERGMTWAQIAMYEQGSETVWVRFKDGEEKEIFLDEIEDVSTPYMQQENKLRQWIRSVLNEGEGESVPHQSTGINQLEILLKKIIPTIEADYKALTTDPEQRRSFRAHIINAIQNSLAPKSTLAHAGEAGGDEDIETTAKSPEEQEAAAVQPEMGQIQENIPEPAAALPDPNGEAGKIPSTYGYGEFEEPEHADNVNPEEAFIDIDQTGANVHQMSPEEQFGISGEEETGRNVAYKNFEKIEKNTTDAYNLLANEDDREMFYDYLLTNLKLYFDKFEDELAGSLPEPTTDAYEQEKNDMAHDGEMDLGNDMGDEFSNDSEQMDADLGLTESISQIILNQLAKKN